MVTVLSWMALDINGKSWKSPVILLLRQWPTTFARSFAWRKDARGGQPSLAVLDALAVRMVRVLATMVTNGATTRKCTWPSIRSGIC